MSIVSAITLLMSCSEEEIGPEHNRKIVLAEQIKSWLTARDFPPLFRQDNHYGGTKHPQAFIFGGGYNWFPEDDFAEFVKKLPWESPRNVVLVIQPEEGETRVYRPNTPDQGYLPEDGLSPTADSSVV